MTTRQASKSTLNWQTERARAPRKINPHSRLKLLPGERQKEIRDYAHVHTLEEAVRWLATSGLKTTISSLSRFLSDVPQLRAADSSEAEILLDVVIQSAEPVRLVVNQRAGAVKLQAAVVAANPKPPC